MSQNPSIVQVSKKRESVHTKKEAETGKLNKRKISLSKKIERNRLTNSLRTWMNKRKDRELNKNNLGRNKLSKIGCSSQKRRETAILIGV